MTLLREIVAVATLYVGMNLGRLTVGLWDLTFIFHKESGTSDDSGTKVTLVVG